MGTSRRWPGPSGGAWKPVKGRLTRSLKQLEKPAGNVTLLASEARNDTGPSGIGQVGHELVAGLSPEEVARLGESYCEALAAELRADPERFGLRSAMEHAGVRLVDILEALDQQGLTYLGPFDGVPVEDRLDEFVARFTDQVALSVGLTADAVIRRAAADSARQLLKEIPGLRRAVETGDDKPSGIGDELFCALYRFFFADAVTTFLRSVIAAKISLMVPALPAVDPAGHITGWIAENITAAIPTPCQDKDAHGSGPSLADLGRNLLNEAVDQALGISTGSRS